MRHLAIVLSGMIALLATVLEAHAASEPYIPDSEVVAVLYDRPYTYGELKLAADDPDYLSRDKSDAKGIFLRARAIAKLRHIALLETLRHDRPECDLSVESAERLLFVSWWRQAAESMAAYLESAAERAHSRRPLPKELRDLDAIESGQPQFSAVAQEKIEIWKANLCLYRIFDGGRVHKKGASAAHVVGYSREGAIRFAVEAGKAFPEGINSAFPLNAYLAHYDAVVSSGVLSFPDAMYEELFFNYYRNQKLSYFAAEEELAVVTTPYWTVRFVAGGADLTSFGK